MSTFNDDVQAAWELYVTELAKLPGVLYVSTGLRVRNRKQTRERVVVVTVAKKLPPEQLIPATLCPRELRLPDGKIVGTDVVEDPVGYYTPDQDTATYRPVPGGCQITPFASAFLGTLGGWFCIRNAENPSGFQVAWLTNAHVADPVNFSTVPADPRMTQPGGLSVIGNTTAISGWPNPLPGPGVIVGGVTDAAVGTLVDEVDADFRVLQIAPAPFEIGTVAGGMAVQKRGRTTRLTNGTVVTQPGGGAFLAANVNSPAGGQVTFGLPGTPRLFRIQSLANGLAAAFGAPGDSGSLVFSRQAGTLTSTFPCVGLYFAGNFRTVAAQPNPNLFRVTGLAFDIGGVMAQLGLDTVCTCVVRALLAAIFDRGPANADFVRVGTTQQFVRRAERTMQRFRDGVLARSSVGKIIAEAVAQTAPDVSRVLAQDETAFGLAVDLLEPWAKASTSLAVLQRKLDERTVRLAVALGKRIIQLCPDTAKRVEPMIKLVQEAEGTSVRELVGSLRTEKLPKVNRAKRKAK
jgi:hypothetical protein